MKNLLRKMKDNYDYAIVISLYVTIIIIFVFSILYKNSYCTVPIDINNQIVANSTISGNVMTLLSVILALSIGRVLGFMCHLGKYGVKMNSADIKRKNLLYILYFCLSAFFLLVPFQYWYVSSINYVKIKWTFLNFIFELIVPMIMYLATFIMFPKKEDGEKITEDDYFKISSFAIYCFIAINFFNGLICYFTLADEKIISIKNLYRLLPIIITFLFVRFNPNRKSDNKKLWIDTVFYILLFASALYLYSFVFIY